MRVLPPHVHDRAGAVRAPDGAQAPVGATRPRQQEGTHRPSSPPALSSAPIWASSSDITALGRAYLHENLFAAHYYPSAPFVPPSMQWQWQTGTSLAPTQPSSALSARVAGGKQVHRGHQQGVDHRGHQQGVDQEETSDGIDMTLRL